MLRLSRYLMALLYIAAGVYHFVSPGTYLKIMPPYIPLPNAMVVFSGIAEVLCGILLMPDGTKKWGAWLTIAVLIAVFPANVQMYLNWRATNHPHLWVAVVRLPLQAVLVWWAYAYTK